MIVATKDQAGKDHYNPVHVVTGASDGDHTEIVKG